MCVHHFVVHQKLSNTVNQLYFNKTLKNEKKNKTKTKILGSADGGGERCLRLLPHTTLLALWNLKSSPEFRKTNAPKKSPEIRSTVTIL